jgi:hypothetical protein
MIEATPETLHYLVVDTQDDRPIFVFLGENPASAGGPEADPVYLEILPLLARFGRPGRPTVGRPVLGQARNSRTRFREFASPEDLWEAGFLPVPHYRVCDDWDDYHSPWSPAPAQPTAHAAADDSA